MISITAEEGTSVQKEVACNVQFSDEAMIYRI